MITALLSGTLGALSVFALGILRQLWLQHQELKGLSKLLYTEVENIYNWFQLSLMEQHRNVFTPKKLDLFTPDVWPDTRVRLAQLMHPDDFQKIAKFYRAVQIFVDHLQDNTMKEEDERYRNRRQHFHRDVLMTGKEAMETLMNPRGYPVIPSEKKVSQL